MTASEPVTPTNFIRDLIQADLDAGKNEGRVHTRFPPEPNGYAHIGHATAAVLNYEVARDFGGKFNLRFDDTNPAKESVEFVEAIQRDLAWVGCHWEDRLYFASDYFEQLYAWAVQLIEAGKAYVDDLSAEEIRQHRGTLTQPGRNSPHRNRSVEENLDLFQRMRAGEFADGDKVLRAKIDMASPNINLRDPVMYRILRAHHHRTGDAWCIYPTYDWAHGQSDAIEGVTHSLCSLEFEDHRPLYDWFIENLGLAHRPRQIEFSRFNLTHTVTSKRHLLRLVEEGHVAGWDDPRMPTLAGMRRRGYPPEAIRDFCQRAGVTKAAKQVEMALLENSLRERLNQIAPRAMAVLRPLKLVIDSYPEGQSERFELPVNPEDPAQGVRQLPFSRELFIERDDFLEDPPKKFFRLAPGREVRLMGAYLITCEAVERDATGAVVALRCRHDPDSRGGNAPDGRKVRGTLHWVSVAHAVTAEVRLYDHLFAVENPGALAEGVDITDQLNPDSLVVLDGCRVEPSLATAQPGFCCQFLRHGYFCADPDSAPQRLVFNRTVSLRDSWAKITNQL